MQRKFPIFNFKNGDNQALASDSVFNQNETRNLVYAYRNYYFTKKI